MAELTEKEREILQKIDEVKRRFPYHSVQPYLIQELEALEEELELVRKEKPCQCKSCNIDE